MKYTTFEREIPYPLAAKLGDYVADGFYSAARLDLLHPYVPSSFLAKQHDAFLMCSASGHYHFYSVVMNRPDKQCIDQDQIIISTNDLTHATTWEQLHNGNYSGRTFTAEPRFFSYISASGLTAPTALPTMPPNQYGRVEDLGESSLVLAHEQARGEWLKRHQPVR